jgi:hypothetical protein
MSKNNITDEDFSQEAHAYTPGLKVKSSTLVQKLRRLPIQGSVLVNAGDEVKYNTIVATTELKGDPELINVASKLGFSNRPEDLPAYMLKKEGDILKEGENFAGYSMFFGIFKKYIPSPINGTLETISTSTGQVVIRGMPTHVQVDAYIPGNVIEVFENEGVTIETNAALIQGIFGIGGETNGIIKIAVDSPEQELNIEKITSEHKGSILIGGSIISYNALQKAVENGVKAIVIGGILRDDLTKFMGEEIGVAITGEENLGITLILTEGFGKMRMAQRTFDIFNRFNGYQASVNGTTQIRAGVIRPEVIIPHKEQFEESDQDEYSAGMIPGTPIRIIRAPLFGSLGKVVSLPVEKQQVESRSYVRVVEIELEDGRKVIVPRANVEIIEE